MRVGTALMVALLASTAASNARAQEDREGIKVELGLTGGYHHFANDLELGVADDPTLPSPKPSAVFGLRVGLVLHPMFVIEGEALGMPTKDNQKGGLSTFISAERIHLRFNIAPGAIAGGALTPFIVVGVGGTSVLTSSGSAYDEIKKGDTDFNFYGGAGLKYAITNLIHVRLDGRVLAAPNTKKDGFSPDWEVTAGFGVTLGGHPPPPPMAPVAALVRDTDRDGIPDDQDKCPREAGPRENGGCPDKDTDGDGIVDRKDKCPDKAGPAERDGCPEEDADKDGIVDSKDKCPNDAEDKDGFEDEDGCPDPDNDKDGVPDKLDKCPNEPETINGYQDDDGCPDSGPPPKAKIDLQKHQIVIMDKVFFDTNKATIKPVSFALLDQVAQILRGHSEIKVEIQGHTDSQGDMDHNIQLSKERAESVRTYLIKKGVDPARMISGGYGPTVPIADNKTKAGREANRRVEFHILEEQKPEKKAPAEGGDSGDANAPEQKNNEGNKGE
jgi:outer membrane protein OmpA-like peptidoglycan-associated protein/opacity protein-like surface antigen